MNAALAALAIAKTHRVPIPAGPAGDAAAAVPKFDAVAMSAGFNLSRGLVARLAALDAGVLINKCLPSPGTSRTLGCVGETSAALRGGHRADLVTQLRAERAVRPMLESHAGRDRADGADVEAGTLMRRHRPQDVLEGGFSFHWDVAQR